MAVRSLQSNICMEISVNELVGSGPLQRLVRAEDAAETYRSQPVQDAFSAVTANALAVLAVAGGESRRLRK